MTSFTAEAVSSPRSRGRGSGAGASADSCLVARPDANLLCSVCLGVFDTPHRTKCGHVFCQQCIHRWLDSQSACPACRAPVDADELVPDRLAAAIIDNLPSHCQLRDKGCTWIGPHRELGAHLASACPCVMLTCAACQEEHPRAALAEHALTCPGGAPMPCPFGCGECIAGADMAQHRAACLYEPRKLLAALSHMQRENERLASENLSLRSQEEPRATPRKRQATRGPGVCIE